MQQFYFRNGLFSLLKKHRPLPSIADAVDKNEGKP